MMSRLSADSRVPRSTTVRSRSSCLTVCRSRSGRLFDVRPEKAYRASPPARTATPAPIRTRVVGNLRPGPSPISGGPEVAESSSRGIFARAGGWEGFGFDGGGGARLIDPDSTRVKLQTLDVPIEGHPGNKVLNPDGIEAVLRPQQVVLLLEQLVRQRGRVGRLLLSLC